ncbi:carbohydrate kinase family protein [Candidatus Woesearchaeota archaeon]|nr:carbohydrate kinase family protein [Candidatus Woesearchaeota archaeon]
MYDIITVGSSTVDVFAKTRFSELIKVKGKYGEREFLAYPTGAKILVDELEFTTGGGATNTAVALSRLGHKVACISKTGQGSNAEKVRKHLEREGIDTSLMASDKKGRTGYSIILDSKKHDRTILAFKGSNNDLKIDELNIRKIDAKWFYFSTMMGESFKTLKKLAKIAEKKKIKIAFNASQYLAEKGISYSKDILKRAGIFVLNREEAGLMTKKKGVEDMLKTLHKLTDIVVITDGSKEAYAYDGRYAYVLRPRKAKVVETTGAGDAFASTFLSGMMKKGDIEFALKLANANAESVIRYHGAKNRLLRYKEALDELKKNPAKVERRELR